MKNMIILAALSDVADDLKTESSKQNFRGDVIDVLWAHLSGDEFRVILEIRAAAAFLWFTIVTTLLLLASPAWAQERLWQTNAAGDDIHIYDITSRTLVRRLVVGANPHGIAQAAGQDIVFVSLEHNGKPAGELLWINKDTFDIEFRLKVGREPHAIAITPDGKWVYVPCRDGSYWVIDVEKRTVAARIETGGRPHNTTASPDGTRIYLSPMGAPKRVTIVDPHDGHKVIGNILFSASTRPPALSFSRNLFFQHVDGLNGFEVAELETNTVIARVKHNRGLGIPVLPRQLGYLGFSGLSRCHGLSVRPGDEEIWSVCGRNVAIHSIDDRQFPEVFHIELPGKGYWLTFSPSGEFAFIALAGKSEIAVIDTATRNIIHTLIAGAHPKRNIVVN